MQPFVFITIIVTIAKIKWDNRTPFTNKLEIWSRKKHFKAIFHKFKPFNLISFFYSCVLINTNRKKRISKSQSFKSDLCGFVEQPDWVQFHTKAKVLLYIFFDTTWIYTLILHLCWIVINLSNAVFLDQQHQLHHPILLHSTIIRSVYAWDDLHCERIYIYIYMLSVFVEVKRNMILYKQAYTFLNIKFKDNTNMTFCNRFSSSFSTSFLC